LIGGEAEAIHKKSRNDEKEFFRRKGMKNRKGILALFALTLAFTTSVAYAQTGLSEAEKVDVATPTQLTFTFTGIGIPGTRYTTAKGINNAGILAGSYIDNFGDLHGMILNNGEVTTVDNDQCLPNDNVVFNGINNKNVAVGSCINFDDHHIGFTWSAGKFTDITIPGAFDVIPLAINDLGEVVGFYVGSDGNQHAFWLKGKTLTTIKPPAGETGGQATGINNLEQITVQFDIPNGFPIFNDDFLFEAGKLTRVNVVFDGRTIDNSLIVGINNHGDRLYNSSSQSFVFHDGTYFQFAQGGGQATEATGFSDNLTIVGGDINPNETWECTVTETQ
jgi:uncharacterized membrane protein